MFGFSKLHAVLRFSARARSALGTGTVLNVDVNTDLLRILMWQCQLQEDVLGKGRLEDTL
jgi:hypothetical protein